MSHPGKILFRSFVRPFYKENAGVFLFIFIMMFYIVGENDGAGLVEYHYSLIMGMLTTREMLLLVFFIWLLYARKFTAFVSGVLKNPQYSFLHIYNRLNKTERFRLFFFVELWLLMPVLIYSIFIVAAGVYHHFYLLTLLIIVFLFLLCILPALWHVYGLEQTHRIEFISLKKLKVWKPFSVSYPFILVRFVVRRQKMIWLGIKVFTCGIFYLIAANNTLVQSDIPTTFLFFNFGIIGNGIILYRLREFEETHLKFYRGMPVSLMKRFFQYALVYFIFLVPEFITAGLLTPLHISYTVATDFSLCAFSLLLLMNTITFLQDFRMRDYLKVILLVFALQYIFISSGHFTLLWLFFFALALILFRLTYYRFEKIV